MKKNKIIYYTPPGLTDRNCGDWFYRFRSCELDVEDNERSGRSKVYKNINLKE